MKTLAVSFLVLVYGTAAAGADKDAGGKMAPKRKKNFTVGKETTYVTGPLEEGYVDYPTALNRRLSKGVTPANNACVLIWKALGPRPEGGKGMPPEFFKWLGIKEPPEKGDYFIDLTRYVREHLKLPPGEKADEIRRQLDRAVQRPWAAKQYPAIASWLKANEKPLAVVVEASRQPQYFSPLTPRRTRQGPSGLMNALLSGVQKCRELVAALAARATLRSAGGDAEGAWQDLLACHRLARLVGRGATVIEALVGIALDGVASRADLVFLESANPDAKRLRRCLGDLRALAPLPDVADKVDLGERFMILEIVLLMDRYGIDYLENLGGGMPAMAKPRARPDIDWDPALRNINRHYDRLVSALRWEQRGLRKWKLDRLDREMRALRAETASMRGRLKALVGGRRVVGESIGNLLLALMVPALLKVDEAAERSRQVADNTSLAFALAWYRRDHGRYPEKLEALAPKYLPQVPGDRFSGKPLVYRPGAKGYLLYSVGVDGEDNGGTTYGDDPPADDLPVRMPLPPLPRQ